jgi:hypothetical protein
MKRWIDLMAQLVAGPIVRYNDVFFDWSRNYMLMVDDYVYGGLEFQGDPYLALLEGSQWGDICKKDIFIYLFIFTGGIGNSRFSYSRDMGSIPRRLPL